MYVVIPSQPFNNMNNDTICALATASGGALGIIRISGSQTFEILSRIFSKDLTIAKPNTIHYGHIYDRSCDAVSQHQSPKIPIDEALVSVFHSPHSYTGEDSAEISCHGSSYILNKVLELLVSNGCRMANPGEYTQRAFLNGKLDLSQAEAVADLIAASNEATHRLAMNQMRGQFSRELKRLRDQLLDMTALLELEIDFSEEDVEFADRQQLLQLAQTINHAITKLVNSFRTGNAIKNGVPVAIIGKTNVGKSTLLNRLLHDDRAIVSDIHGTTRDTIEDTINIGGITFRFIDTAGIRQTQDAVEQIGIQRTYAAIDKAQIVLWLIDAIPTDAEITNITTRTQGKTLIIVHNKIDKENSTPHPAVQHTRSPFANLHFGDTHYQSIKISAKLGTNIEQLEQLLVQATNLTPIEDTDIIVSNQRHVTALRQALEAITQVEHQIIQGISSDIITLDLHACIDSLSEIVGDISSDDTLQTIFSRFCVGK